MSGAASPSRATSRRRSRRSSCNACGYAAGTPCPQVAEALGRSSKNAYARYEQGEAIPTIEKFEELLHAVSNDATLIIGPQRGTKKAPSRSRIHVTHPG
jgi:transcriptional regulator with XRE-family HTH domain